MFLTHFDYFKTSASIFIQKRLNKELKLPWMSKKEIHILKKIILKNKSDIINVLEWGSGYSTFYFSQLVPNINWYSVEHNKEWYDSINENLNKLNNVNLKLVEPDQYPWTDINNDGDFEDLYNYILYPKNKIVVNEKKLFDIILIDGRARKSCLENSHDIIKDTGIVIVHDANRKYYFENRIKKFKYEYFFNDDRLDGGLFIGMNQSFEKDILKFKSIWNYFK